MKFCNLFVSIKCCWEKLFVYRTIQQLINNRFQKKLNNDDFSILCSNCIGGCIYHRLGKRFLSPTINMWFSQPEFIVFLLHLDEYLVLPLRFVETVEKTPVAKIGGGLEDLPEITLHFNHAKSTKEAKEMWDSRKVRINKENLYIILYNLDGVTVSQLQQLDNYPCNNKIVLTQIEMPDITWSKYLRKPKFGQYADSYLGKDIFGIRYYEKKWDFVGFLNKKQS